MARKPGFPASRSDATISAVDERRTDAGRAAVGDTLMAEPRLRIGIVGARAAAETHVRAMAHLRGSRDEVGELHRQTVLGGALVQVGEHDADVRGQMLR
ncbi:MAG: hypothetical protein ACREMB_11985, partial [Candidatus Rokuibacteriota bacterium]